MPTNPKIEILKLLLQLSVITKEAKELLIIRNLVNLTNHISIKKGDYISDYDETKAKIYEDLFILSKENNTLEGLLIVNKIIEYLNEL